MKSNLIALAVAALVGGMLVVPLTHQSAMAQVHAGIKGLGSTGGTPTTGTAPVTRTAEAGPAPREGPGEPWPFPCRACRSQSAAKQ